ncbi:high choriolytic enzyme 1-like [Rhinatrema bivittatum]|uniref:high choriolytic enzyme 1-like n=1 Tax=Rhinatrema bivittatum TaxID=194408 RepID=UPI0011264B51|nr:high choriolytic enzyme 1-like [Rhinatrema bivittatum]
MSPTLLAFLISALLALACGLPLGDPHRQAQDGPNSVLQPGKPHKKVLLSSVRRLWAEIREEEDPDTPDQILKVNEHLMTGRPPAEGPPIIFGDIAVDPLGNADRCASDRCRWPSADNGQVVVPYIISESYSSSEQAVIESGLRSFSTRTCIMFRPRSNERDYISIESQSGCFSFIGRVQGRQVVSLQKQGCVFQGIVQHELLHALGFHHEQNRSDRDGFVDIFFQNIMPGMESNFRKVQTNNLGTRYDYSSVMHYGRTAFSRNGRPTIVPKPDPNVAIGNRRDFSPEDITKVNRLYCSRIWNQNRLLRDKAQPEEDRRL